MAKRKAAEPGDAGLRPSKRAREDEQLIHMGAGHFLRASLFDENTVSMYQPQILDEAKRTPRFLFRMWSEQSCGGHPGLNTTRAITPKAFATGRSPDESLFDMPFDEFCKLARGHVAFQTSVNTVFSSWSQSLQTVLRMAANTRWKARDIHICILDTKTLGPQNIILNTSFLHQVLDGSIAVFRDEYLAYGIIRSENGYSAVPYQTLWPYVDSVSILWDRGHSTAQLCHIASTMGSLFKPDLQMVFAAFIMALSGSADGSRCKSDEYRSRYLRQCFDITAKDISPTWVMDRTIMQDKYARTYGRQEWDRAAATLRTLIAEVLGKTKVEKLQRSALDAEARYRERWKALIEAYLVIELERDERTIVPWTDW